MIRIDDPALPGLQELAQDRLRAITGASEVEVLRLRYRRGRRAILHLSSIVAGTSELREGAIWFYPGDKARRLAKRNGGAVFDPATNALYQWFPHDHRMPEIRDFLAGYADHIVPLIGGEAEGPPKLVRYRPGLSSTFRCLRRDGAAFFIKLQRDEAVARLAAANASLADALDGTRLRIARVVATSAELNAVSYAAAPGQCLETLLRSMDAREAAGQVADVCASLRDLWSAPVTPARLYDRQALLDCAEDAGRMICATVPRSRPQIRKILDRLRRTPVQIALRPIHADLKLEHVFAEAGTTTLIDTESLSLGPPDYDIAQLHGRLHVAAQGGEMPDASVAAACQVLHETGGRSLDWCLGVVAVRLAKFHAQRPDAESAERIADLLLRLGQMP